MLPADARDAPLTRAARKTRDSQLARDRAALRASALATIAKRREVSKVRDVCGSTQETTRKQGGETGVRSRILSDGDQAAMTEMLDMAIGSGGVGDQIFAGGSSSHSAQRDFGFNLQATQLGPVSAPGLASVCEEKSIALLGTSSVVLGTSSAAFVQGEETEASAITLVNSGTLTSRKKKAAKKDPLPEPAWKIADYLKDEAWFRDVVGLPADGVNPAAADVAPEDLARFYGPKGREGYPWRADSKSALTQDLRDEIMHIVRFTDGRAHLNNDNIPVIFAKGFYIWKQGKPVNWARFAALKHKNQLEGQFKRVKLHPLTPAEGTGIRETVKYIPFGAKSDWVPNIPSPPLVEGPKVDHSPNGDAHADGLPSSTLNNMDLDITTASEVPVNNVGQFCRASAFSSKVDTERGVSPVACSSPAGSIQIAADNYQLLDDYMMELSKENDLISKELGKLQMDHDSLTEKKSRNEKTTVDINKQVTELQDDLDMAGKRRFTDGQEIERLKTRRCELQEQIEVNIENANEAKDEDDEDYVEECLETVKEGEAQLDAVDREIATMADSLEEIDNRMQEWIRKKEQLHTQSKLLEVESSTLMVDIPQLAPKIKAIQERSCKLDKFRTEILETKQRISSVQGQVVSPRMIPSPCRSTASLFKITNCPVCHLGFTCCNFLPTSCGHCYHPACGIPYFLSQPEPRCKSCDQLVHASWLNSWGIKAGKGNSEMAEGLGLSQLESTLVKEDFALRKDEEAYMQLQLENTSARRSVTRIYSVEGVRSQRTMNSTHIAVLRGGARNHSPLASAKLFDALTPQSKSVANANVAMAVGVSKVKDVCGVTDSHGGHVKTLLVRKVEKIEKSATAVPQVDLSSTSTEGEEGDVKPSLHANRPPVSAATRSKSGATRATKYAKETKGRKRKAPKKADEEEKGEHEEEKVPKRRCTDSDLGSSATVKGANLTVLGTDEIPEENTKIQSPRGGKPCVAKKATARSLKL